MVTVLRRLVPRIPAHRVDQKAVAATLALIVAGATLCVLRQRGAGALHTLWAEDGKIFLGDAINRSVLGAFRRPYNGYLHLGPRAIAAVAAMLPVRDAAFVMSGVAALGAAAMAAIGYHASGPHIPSRLVRLVLAAFVVLLPSAAREAANNAANLHWYLLYAGFWLLLWSTRRPLDLTIAAVVLAFAALSDPLSTLLLPVLAVRLAVVRDRRTLIPAGVFALALGLQMVAVATYRAQRFIEHHITWYDTILGYVRSGLGHTFVETPGWLANPHQLAVGSIVLAGVLPAAAVTAVRRRERIPLLVLLLGMSVVTYVVPVRISGYSVPRYWVLPALFVITSLGVCVNDALRRASDAHRARLRFGIVAAVVAFAAVDLSFSYSIHGVRARGPSWEAGLRMAHEQCSVGATTVAVPITPRGTVYHWSVTLPCDRLGRSAGGPLARRPSR